MINLGVQRIMWRAIPSVTIHTVVGFIQCVALSMLSQSYTVLLILWSISQRLFQIANEFLMKGCDL